MNRSLKALAPVLAATLLATALSAGSAVGAEFHSESTTTFSHGNQVTENVFKTSAGNVKCKKATFAGKGTAKTANTAQITPSFLECTGFGQKITMTMNGCTFKGSATSATTGKSEIVCPAGKVIQVEVPSANCSLTIPGQVPGVSTVDFKNEGTGSTRDILVTATAAQIKYTVDGPGTICGTPGTYEGEKGAGYTGTVTQKGFSSEALTTQVGVWVE